MNKNIQHEINSSFARFPYEKRLDIDFGCTIEAENAYTSVVACYSCEDDARRDVLSRQSTITEVVENGKIFYEVTEYFYAVAYITKRGQWDEKKYMIQVISDLPVAQMNKIYHWDSVCFQGVTYALFRDRRKELFQTPGNQAGNILGYRMDDYFDGKDNPVIYNLIWSRQLNEPGDIDAPKGVHFASDSDLEMEKDAMLRELGMASDDDDLEEDLWEDW